MLRSGMMSSSGCNSSDPLPPALLKKLEQLNPWHEQVEALQQLADLTIPLSKTADADAIMRQLRPSSHDLAEVINNPRSTLVKEACLCIETMAETFGPKFVAAVGIDVVPALLKRCAITKAVIRDSAREAAKAMFEHGVEGVHIGTARFISQAVLDKHAPVLTRAAAAEFIGMILVDRCRGSLSEIHQLISGAIIGGCCDSDETVRAISRDNCCRLFELEPALGAEVFAQLPGSAQQYIARTRSIPKAMDEEPVRLRRASMMPQRAPRPRLESFAANVPLNLKARYAPSRVHRASINPVELGSHMVVKDATAPRAAMFPRPGRVEFECRPNLARKQSRPNLRPPRRSMVPRLAAMDVYSNAIKGEDVSKSLPSTSVIAPSDRVMKTSMSAEMTSLVETKAAAKYSKNKQDEGVGKGVSKSPLSTSAPRDAHEEKATSPSAVTDSTEGCECESEQKTVSGADSETKVSGSSNESTPEARGSRRHSRGDDTRVDCEATPDTRRSSSGYCDDAAAVEGGEKSGDDDAWADEAQEEGEKRVNKCRLSFILGVNETPRVMRTRRALRPDMSAMALMASPGSVAGADCPEVEVGASRGGDARKDGGCVEGTEATGAVVERVGAAAAEAEEQEAQTADGDEDGNKTQGGTEEEEEEDALPKTPQLCMPDVSDFAELMADIEKQARRSVAPTMAVGQEGGTGSSDKENALTKNWRDSKPTGEAEKSEVVKRVRLRVDEEA
ncbi:unnamed protein product, partial [Agarophyton chilense]